MILSNFFYPNGGDDKFTIEERHGGKLVLYYYDPVACVSRPIVVLDNTLHAEIPFLNLTDKGKVVVSDGEEKYYYPSFDLLNEFEIKTTLINRHETFSSRELDELYLYNIAKGFHKLKHMFEPLWSKK